MGNKMKFVLFGTIFLVLLVQPSLSQSEELGLAGGVMDGLNVDLKPLIMCAVGEGQQLVGRAMGIVSLVEDDMNILAAIGEAQAVVQGAKSALETCMTKLPVEEAMPTVQKVMALLDNRDPAMQIGLNFLKNSIEIIKEVKEAVMADAMGEEYKLGKDLVEVVNLLLLDDAEPQDLECIGKHMPALNAAQEKLMGDLMREEKCWCTVSDDWQAVKDELVATLFECITGEEVNLFPEIDPNDVSMGVFGLLKGLYDVDFQDQDPENVTIQAREVFAEMLDDLHHLDVVGAFIYLNKALAQMNDDLAKTEADEMPTVSADTTSMIEVLKNPENALMNVALNAVINLEDVLEEIEENVQDHDFDNAFGAGDSFGDLLHLLLLGKRGQDAQEKQQCLVGAAMQLQSDAESLQYNAMVGDEDEAKNALNRVEKGVESLLDCTNFCDETQCNIIGNTAMLADFGTMILDLQKGDLHAVIDDFEELQKDERELHKCAWDVDGSKFDPDADEEAAEEAKTEL